MRFRTLLFSAVLPFFCGTALSAATVAVDVLNVRVAPTRDSMVAGTVVRGTVLRILSEKDGWAAVEAPASLPVWIASVFVRDGSSLKGARLRSGPGVVYPEYELRLPENTKLSVLETRKDDFWLRVRPPEHLVCYVSARYLERTGGENAGKETKRTSPYIPGDERPVSLEGKLVPLGKSLMDSRYELILEINRSRIPVCYLVTRHLNLKLWENRTVRIDGTQRWIKGIKRPFVEIEKVSPSWK